MEDLLLTFDDLVAGAPVLYDALVLYSETDQAFVEELTRNMPGFRLFTRYRDHLLPNVIPLDVMCKLITTRCRFIILIYSPAFFEILEDRPSARPGAETPEEAVRRIEAERRVEADRLNRYYADFVLANKIASNARQQMIPCVYQECALPDSYKHNFMLYVNSDAYNFYGRLSKVLRPSSLPPSSAPMIGNRASRTESVGRPSIVRRFTRWCQALAGTQNRHSASRDWRGLATLIGLTTQESEQLCAMKVLEMWVRRDENSTVHHLLRHLETMGRYDLIDDLKQLAAQNRLVNTEKWVTEEPTRPQGTSANIGFTPLTVADLGAGGPVLYDAAVLHADAEPEIEFANTLIEKMTKIGFKLFRKDDLQSNVMPLGAMTELINTRCRHIIVIFSPAFSQSPDDQFLSQYVHANQIAQKSHQMILCEFETCERSLELKFYRPMRVKNNPDFWWRLAYNLNASREDQLPMPSWIQSIMHSSANLIPSDPTSTRTLPGTANVPVADEANAPGYNHQIEGGHCSQHTDPDVANDNSTRTCSVTWAADIPEVTPNGFDSNAQHLNGSFANHSVAEYVSNEYVLNESDGSESVADNFVANDSIANGNDQVANETVAYYNVTDGPHQPTNYIVNIQVISENIGVHPNGHSSQPFNIKYPKERSDTRVVILRSILENVAQWCHKQSRVVRNRLEGIYKPIKTDTYIYQKNPAH